MGWVAVAALAVFGAARHVASVTARPKYAPPVNVTVTLPAGSFASYVLQRKGA